MQERHPEQKHVTTRLYREILNAEFNIAVFKPKKDPRAAVWCTL